MTAESILIATFWIGCGGTVYAYLGFPALVRLLAATKSLLVVNRGRNDAHLSVTVIIPAYNEERSIDAKIRNVLAAAYPRDLLDVLVVSDASTDSTDAIARSFGAEGVRLLVQERRRGKTAGLNRAIELARGALVVFTDANATYQPGTIAALTAYFDDPDVGLVTGYTKYVTGGSGEVVEATNAYTSLERAIKTAESRWGCCIGADGAIFAMRRSLYRSLREDDINDFVLPLSVIGQGYRCVFAEDAWCAEHPGKSVESEFRRQARITNRTLRALWRHRHLLNPIRYGMFSFFLFSHKVVRFLVPALLGLSAVSLVLLAGTRGGVYLIAVASASVVVGLAAASRSKPSEVSHWSFLGRLLYFLNVFLTINLAVLQGWWKFLRGRRDVTWQHDRSQAA
jgi:cellulose synthase/poly-beta-1,6-N-acetylglucosamine synthase-like glycosyltransferase